MQKQSVLVLYFEIPAIPTVYVHVELDCKTVVFEVVLQKFEMDIRANEKKKDS